ncbi:MAG: hypothetical protein VW683_01445 [Betaproteobacteria bacterium]|jgi:hypothetical protein
MRNIQQEPLPWNVWVAKPENKNLPLDEQRRKYDIERNAEIQKMMFYEASKRGQ